MEAFAGQISQINLHWEDGITEKLDPTEPYHFVLSLVQGTLVIYVGFSVLLFFLLSVWLITVAVMGMHNFMLP